MRPLAVAVALLASACFDLSIAADDYDRACSADEECVPVFEGDACAVCACANAGIRASEQARFTADATRLRGWCGPRGDVLCSPCLDQVAVCASGRCDVQPRP